MATTYEAAKRDGIGRIVDDMLHANRGYFLDFQVKEWGAFHESVVEAIKPETPEVMEDQELGLLVAECIAGLRRANPERVLILLETLDPIYGNEGFTDYFDSAIKAGQLKQMDLFFGPGIHEEHENKLLIKSNAWHQQMGEGFNFYYMRHPALLNGVFSPDFSAYQGLHMDCNLFRDQYHTINPNAYDIALKHAEQFRVEKLKNRFESLLDPEFWKK